MLVPSVADVIRVSGRHGVIGRPGILHVFRAASFRCPCHVARADNPPIPMPGRASGVSRCRTPVSLMATCVKVSSRSGWPIRPGGSGVNRPFGSPMDRTVTARKQKSHRHALRLKRFPRGHCLGEPTDFFSPSRRDTSDHCPSSRPPRPSSCCRRGSPMAGRCRRWRGRRCPDRWRVADGDRVSLCGASARRRRRGVGCWRTRWIGVGSPRRRIATAVRSTSTRLHWRFSFGLTEMCPEPCCDACLTAHYRCQRTKIGSMPCGYLRVFPISAGFFYARDSAVSGFRCV